MGLQKNASSYFCLPPKAFFPRLLIERERNGVGRSDVYLAKIQICIFSPFLPLLRNCSRGKPPRKGKRKVGGEGGGGDIMQKGVWEKDIAPSVVARGKYE